MLCCVMFDCDSFLELSCVVSARSKKKSCWTRVTPRESRAQEGKEGHVGVRETVQWDTQRELEVEEGCDHMCFYV